MSSRRSHYGAGRIFRKSRHGVEYGNYIAEYFVGGVQHRENTKTTSHAEASRILKTRQGEVAAGRPPAPRAGRVTIAELFDDLDATYALQQAPNRRNLPSIRAAWLDAHALGPRATASELSTAQIERICGAWRGTVTDSTINRRVEMLRRAVRLAARRTPPKILQVPTFPSKLREDNVRESFVADRTVAKILGYLRTLDVVVADFLEWFFWLGMRPGAIRDLEWTAIDRETWALRLVKNPRANKGKPRWLPLHGPLKAIIERAWARRLAYAEETGTIVPWVFWRVYDGHPRPGLARGDAVRIVDYRKAWKSAVEAAGHVAGRAGLIPYDLRRTAARNLKRHAHADDTTIMAITGHKHRSMLDRYNIVDNDAIADAIARTVVELDGVLGSGGEVRADVGRISAGSGRHEMAARDRKAANSRRRVPAGAKA